MEYYGSEEQCYEVLFKLRWLEGIRSPNFGHDKSYRLIHRKLQHYHRSHRQTLITAGTVLVSTNLPPTVWSQAIYLIMQDKKGCIGDATTLQVGYRLKCGMANEAQVDEVMHEREACYQFSGLIRMDDVCLGGERNSDKRGRGAAGNTPLVEADETTQKGYPKCAKLSTVKGFRKLKWQT